MNTAIIKLITAALLLACATVTAAPVLKLRKPNPATATVDKSLAIGGDLGPVPPGSAVEFRATMGEPPVATGKLQPARNPNGASTTFTPDKAGSVTIRAEIVDRNRKLLAEDKFTILVNPAKPEPGVAAGTLLTDFSVNTNVMKGGFFDQGEAWADGKVVNEPLPSTHGEVLAAIYKVINPGSFSGVWLKGTRLAPLSDLGKKWKAISIAMRGDAEKGFPKNLKIEVKAKGFGWKVCYLDTIRKQLTEEWQTFEFPVGKFTNLDEWTSDEFEVVFTFENTVADKRQGVIYVDDIRLLEK
ncbi:MAG: hypothetical protein ABMA01_14345 [Chthoniobacteraceae bacterium]